MAKLMSEQKKLVEIFKNPASVVGLGEKGL